MERGTSARTTVQMSGSFVGEKVPLVGKPSWKASHLRRNHLKPHKDPKALTPSLTVGLTEYQPEASAAESGVGTAKTTDKL